MEQRSPGDGEIEKRRLKDGRIRYRARPRHDGKRYSLGTFDSYEEAAGAITVFLETMERDHPIAGETLASWSRRWLDERETDGVHRSVARDRHTFKRVTRADIAALPMAAITPRDVREWVAAQVKERPARQTVQNALNLLRVCLEAACERGLIERNPALGVKVPKMARTKERWTWLKPAEIERAIGPQDEAGDTFAVAIYTGLRAGELFGLEWRDVDMHAGVATIRHSWQGAPTKRGEVRRVSLIEPALAALRRQRERAKGSRYVFPDREGHARTKDQARQLGRVLKARVGRQVRIHDLRHTCASHLLQGTWAPHWVARPLRLEEVQVWLGHTSPTTTARYAHLCPEGVAGLVVRAERPVPAKVVPLRRVNKSIDR